MKSGAFVIQVEKVMFFGIIIKIPLCKVLLVTLRNDVK